MQKEKVCVLLVDDNPVDIEIIKTILNEQNTIICNIDTASSGAEAIEKAANSKFHLALVDYRLPGMSGIEVLEAINKRKLDLPVIIITGEGDEKIAVEAMKKGTYDYLTKDEINNVVLTRSMLSVLKRKSLEDKVKESHKELKNLAIRDGLTGLYNHRHFQEILSNEYKRAKRHGHLLSCMMLDLDHFKLVNDTHGHQFGDFVLAQSAKILKKLVRDIDFVARYGGEEFFIILPNTDMKGTIILAERICNSFAHNKFKKGKISEVVTVSIGVSSTANSNVGKKGDIIANADSALYHAKRRGRNNVCVWEEIESEVMFNIKEEEQKIRDFHSRFNAVSRNIKETCIESVRNILSELKSEGDYINKHSLRSSLYAVKLAKELSMPDEDIDVIKHAALLHDIGMVGISSDILKKAGKLTHEEYDLIKRHSHIGVNVIEQIKLFGKELQIILYHHERFDGSGYPHRLRGDMIPLEARILAVAEAYDVMISETVYHKASSSKDAIAELKRCAGSQFDPQIVNAFIKAVKRGD